MFEEQNLKPKEKLQFIRAVGKWYDEDDYHEKEVEKFKKDMKKMQKKNGYGFMETVQIAMIVFKNKNLENLFLEFYGYRPPCKAPKIDFSNQKEEVRTMIHNQYFKKALELMSIGSGFTTVYSKRDAPMKFENDYMIIYLAPRIETG